MSEEQLKAFLEAVKADNALQEKLKTAGDADAVVAIAKAAGFLISAEELLGFRFTKLVQKLLLLVKQGTTSLLILPARN